MAAARETSDESTLEEVGDEPPAHPVDRGWAWFILLSSWLNMFFVVGMYKTFGIFFIEFQQKYNSSSSMTSLTISVLNLGYSLTTLCVSSVLLTVLSSRQCVMIGSVLVCLVYILSAFAPTIEVLVLSFGLLLGVSQALILPPTTTILGQYFNKRRSLANCTAQIGASSGSLVFPILLRALLDNYSLFGTLLFVGALNLHMTVSGTLLRPTSYYGNTKLRRLSRSDEGQDFGSERDSCQEEESKAAFSNGRLAETVKDAKITYINQRAKKSNHTNACRNSVNSDVRLEPQKYVNKDVGKPSTENYERAMVKEAINHDNVEAEISVHNLANCVQKDVKEPLISNSQNVAHEILYRKSRQPHVSESSSSKKMETFQAAVSNMSLGRNSNLGLYASTELSVSSALDLRDKDEPEYVKSASEVFCCFKWALFSKVFGMLDCRVLRRPPFWFFLPSACLLCSSCSMIIVFLPPHARDKGLSDSEITIIVSVIGAVDILSLISWGFMADCGVIKRYQLVTISTVLLGITAHLISLFVHFYSFIVLSIICGLFGRVYFSMYPVLLVDFLGLDYLRNALGLIIVTQTIFNASVIPLVGLIRDSTGSYVLGFHAMGTMMVAGGLWLLTIPLAVKFERKYRNNQNNETGDISKT